MGQAVVGLGTPQVEACAHRKQETSALHCTDDPSKLHAASGLYWASASLQRLQAMTATATAAGITPKAHGRPAQQAASWGSLALLSHDEAPLASEGGR